MAPKIVVTNNQDLTGAQISRLNSLGDVTYYDTTPQNAQDFLSRVKGADIICSGTAGLKDAYVQLKDVYVTVAFVSIAFVDIEVLKKNNVTISNAPGANRYAVSEWVMCMITLMMRNLCSSINREETYRKDGSLPPITNGLAGKKITILGKGNVGRQVGSLAHCYAMDINYFTRGDDLFESVKDADVVVDALSSNPSTYKMLNASFFSAMKQGSCFASVTRGEILDEDALMDSLDSGHLEHAASDLGGIAVGDTDDVIYKKMLAHPKIIVTPHISYSTQMTQIMGGNIMIDNVEAYIKGNPQNVVES